MENTRHLQDRRRSTTFVAVNAQTKPIESWNETTRKGAPLLVLDAQALEAYLCDEPAAAAVEALLMSGEQKLMATVNLAELVDRMRRVRGVSSATLVADLVLSGIHFSALDAELAVAAAELRAIHYHRTTCPVSIADCTAAALALDRGACLVTSDPALLRVVLDEAGQVQALAGSDGSVWSPGAQR